MRHLPPTIVPDNQHPVKVRARTTVTTRVSPRRRASPNRALLGGLSGLPPGSALALSRPFELFTWKTAKVADPETPYNTRYILPTKNAKHPLNKRPMYLAYPLPVTP